jgi:hypothetical protein
MTRITTVGMLLAQLERNMTDRESPLICGTDLVREHPPGWGDVLPEAQAFALRTRTGSHRRASMPNGLSLQQRATPTMNRIWYLRYPAGIAVDRG